MSAAAIGVAWLLARLASMRGLGRQWGLWVGCGLLVAGVLGNGISSLLWARGIPDFIDVGGGWAWNLADFEIAFGMSGGLLSVFVSAFVLYGRERIS
jgi:lipoprotein signal peptidase